MGGFEPVGGFEYAIEEASPGGMEGGVTREVCAHTGHWLGEGMQVTVVDTPGFGNSLEEEEASIEQFVDFLKDGQISQEKVFTASKLTVSPGAFDIEDAGVCSFADTDTFVLNSWIYKEIEQILTLYCLKHYLNMASVLGI